MSRLTTDLGDEHDRTLVMVKAAVGVGGRANVRLSNRERYTIEVRKTTATFPDGSTGDVALLFAVPQSGYSRQMTAVDWPSKDGVAAIRVVSRFDGSDDWGRTLASQTRGDYDYKIIGGAMYLELTDDKPGPNRELVAAIAPDFIRAIVEARRKEMSPYLDALAASPLAPGQRIAAEIRQRFPDDVASLSIEQATDAAAEFRGGLIDELRRAVMAEAGYLAGHLRIEMTADESLYTLARLRGYDIGSVEARVVTGRGSRRLFETTVTRHGRPLERAPDVGDGRVEGWPEMDLDTAMTVIRESAEILATRQAQRGRPEASGFGE